jgi:hypothetical protein
MARSLALLFVAINKKIIQQPKEKSDGTGNNKHESVNFYFFISHHNSQQPRKRAPFCGKSATLKHSYAERNRIILLNLSLFS